MEKKSWLCTLITQFFLFVALFVAINIGRPQKKREYQISRDGRATFDLYFISVRGGSRSLQEQFRLLEQVENVLKTYKAKFVVDISELGEEDPLMQNATRYLQSLKVPWYTTNALKRRGADYFLKQVKIAEEKTLDLIALDTGSLKDPSSGTGRDQLHWLTRILETSNGNWHLTVVATPSFSSVPLLLNFLFIHCHCICHQSAQAHVVAGFHPMVACDKSIDQMVETKQDIASLHHIFLKYGVNAYLSAQDCANHEHKGDIEQIIKGPYFTIVNKKDVSRIGTDNGFLLHRVSSLEIATYSVSLNGEVVHRITLQQLGKAVM